MPALGIEQVAELLTLALIHGVCQECGQRTAYDYCRSCDEFYWLHAPGCMMYETKHFGHRLTVVPFVETSSASTALAEIIFFPNGCTAALQGGEQQPDLQQPWLELFAEWLILIKEEDPTRFALTLPSGHKARFTKTDFGWSWRFEAMNDDEREVLERLQANQELINQNIRLIGRKLEGLRVARGGWHERARIYPHGAPEQAAEATVLYAGQDVILASFAAPPPFLLSRVDRQQVYMMLHRVIDSQTGKGVGPWIENGGGHYEVECLHADSHITDLQRTLPKDRVTVNDDGTIGIGTPK